MDGVQIGAGIRAFNALMVLVGIATFLVALNRMFVVNAENWGEWGLRMAPIVLSMFAIGFAGKTMFGEQNNTVSVILYVAVAWAFLVPVMI